MVASDVISKHPEPKFDELMALWFGEEIHRKYKVNSKPIFPLICSYENQTFNRNV